MKKLIKKLKNKLTILSGAITSTLILAQSRVYAASNTESIDSFINFACDWLTKIGGVIALVGRSYVCFRLAKRRFGREISWLNDFNDRLYACCYRTI